MNPVTSPTATETDWERLRARVADSFDLSHKALQPSAEQAKEILDQRARHLARPQATGEVEVDSLEILPFSLGRERYCLETRFTREVVRLTEFTVLPEAPNFLLGVTNLRGDILPIFDLMLFFGFASQGLMDRSRVIVIGQDSADFGIISDSVQEVTRLLAGDLATDAVFEGQRGQECVRGLTRSAMIVLDGEALMREPRLFIGSGKSGL